MRLYPVADKEQTNQFDNYYIGITTKYQPQHKQEISREQIKIDVRPS